MTLSATFDKAKNFRELLAAVSPLAHECVMQCSAQGIHLQTMDSAHVALVEFALFEGAFAEYQCTQNIALGVNLLALQKVLRCGSDSARLTLGAVSDGEELSVELKEANGTSRFNVRLLDLDQEQLGIPDTEPEAEVTLSSHEFTSKCKNIATLGDEVMLRFARDAITFSVSGDTGNGEISLNHGETPDCALIQLNGAEEIVAKFAMPYLVHFCRGGALSDRVTIKYSTNMPMSVEYDLTMGDVPVGLLRYFLAPKIEFD